MSELAPSPHKYSSIPSILVILMCITLIITGLASIIIVSLDDTRIETILNIGTNESKKNEKTIKYIETSNEKNKIVSINQLLLNNAKSIYKSITSSIALIENRALVADDNNSSILRNTCISTQTEDKAGDIKTYQILQLSCPAMSGESLPQADDPQRSLTIHNYLFQISSSYSFTPGVYPPQSKTVILGKISKIVDRSSSFGEHEWVTEINKKDETFSKKILLSSIEIMKSDAHNIENDIKILEETIKKQETDLVLDAYDYASTISPSITKAFSRAVFSLTIYTMIFFSIKMIVKQVQMINKESELRISYKYATSLGEYEDKFIRISTIVSNSQKENISGPISEILDDAIKKAENIAEIARKSIQKSP